MKKLIYSILVVAATALMTAQRTPSNPASTVTPPVAKKIHTENHIHGGTLVDDYRWLREKSNADPSSGSSSNLSAWRGDKSAALFLLGSLKPRGWDKVPRSDHRKKVSTTISVEAHELLRRLVESGRVATLAEAVDEVVKRARRTENRSRLEQATAAYFARLSRAAAQEEKELGLALGQSGNEVRFDD